ncbi:MAG: HEAT repeat domain-containing protein [Phycisphaerales bacterium]
MSRPIDTFFQRIAQVRHFPPVARVAALAAGLSVCSLDEARGLVPELIEMAAQVPAVPAVPFASTGPAVRLSPLNWFRNRRDATRRHVADIALEALIRHWDRVPSDLVPLIASAGRGRFGVAAAASRDADPAIRANVVAAAGELGEGQLARLVGSMLADEDKSVAKAAEHALVHMALGEFARTRTGEACLDPRLVEQLWRVREAAEFGFSRENRAEVSAAAGEASDQGASREGVIDGIATACEAFEHHRRRGVLVCAMLLLDRTRLASRSPRAAAHSRERHAPDRLAAWFAKPVTDAHSALRTVLRASVLPVAGLRAMEWIGVEPWTRACSERLSRGGTVLEHELALASAHLTLRPRRRAALARVIIKSRPANRDTSDAPDEPRATGTRVLEPGLLPDVAIVNSLSIDAGRGAARIVGVVSATAPDRELAARSFLGHADPVARHAVMRAMPGSGLRDWVFDDNDQISAGAALRMSRADDPRAAEAEESDLAWWRQLARAPQPRTRFLAEEELAQRAELMSGTVRGRLLAARRMTREPEGVVTSISESLGQPESQSGAISLLRRLGLAPTFQQQLVDLALQATDARVAATAVAALADVSSESAMDAAVTSLRHTDSRVRANAVETLGHRARSGEALPTQIVELKHDAHHRVRANALRLELGLAPAPSLAGELAAMLRDERAEHRLAGAWLASRALGGNLKRRLGADADQLALRLVELASGDPDDRVRRRAAIGASRVMGELRASWRSGPATGGTPVLAGGPR